MKKKVFWLAVVLLLFVTLTQCNTQTPNSIKQAKLTGSEQKILELFQGNWPAMVFDFRCEEGEREIVAEVWRLDEGKQWQSVTQQSVGLIGKEGRLFVLLQEPSGDLYLATQSKKENFGGKVSLEGALKGFREQAVGGWGIDIIKGEKGIVLDEKMPLCVWFGSTKVGTLQCFSIEEFENLQEYRYDDTVGYALTLRFIK